MGEADDVSAARLHSDGYDLEAIVPGLSQTDCPEFHQ